MGRDSSGGEKCFRHVILNLWAIHHIDLLFLPIDCFLRLLHLYVTVSRIRLFTTSVKTLSESENDGFHRFVT
jgi:hypothetical protein